MRGLPAHTAGVEALANEYRGRGYRVILPHEKLPSWIGWKDDKLAAIITIHYHKRKNKGWHTKKPLATYVRRYPHLDTIFPNRVKNGQDNIQHGIKATVSSLRQQGWTFIYKGRKQPDAIAIKQNEVVALEVLTARKGDPNLRHTVKAKKAAYGMFPKVDVRVLVPATVPYG